MEGEKGLTPTNQPSFFALGLADYSLLQEKIIQEKRIQEKIILALKVRFCCFL